MVVESLCRGRDRGQCGRMGEKGVEMVHWVILGCQLNVS